jgi:hypothetical protein
MAEFQAWRNYLNTYMLKPVTRSMQELKSFDFKKSFSLEFDPNPRAIPSVS